VAITIPQKHQAHPLFFGVTGLAIIAAAVWIFLLILQSVYGRYELSEIMPTKANLEAAFSTPVVGIVESRNADLLTTQADILFHENIKGWQHLLEAMEIRYETVNDSVLASGDLSAYAVLVLPGVKALSDTQMVRLKQYLNDGGSLYATGGTGSYTERGDWRGWNFLSEVFGLQYTKDITPDQATRLHSLRGGLPITGGIPTGFSLNIATWDHPMACEVLERRTTQASTWYNFATDSGLVRDAVEKTAGIAYGRYGRGRFVWMGFDLNSVIGDQKDYIAFDILCRRSIDWLMHTPTVQVRDWPAPYTAAASLLVSCEGRFDNVPALEAVMRSERLPLTFFVSPGSDRSFWPPASLLRSPSNAAMLVDAEQDSARFAESIGGVRPGTPVSQAIFASDQGARQGRTRFVGALPVGGRYNEMSLHGLLEGGFTYVAGDSMTDRAVPETIIRGRQSIVAFGKTARGDEEVVRRFGLRDTAFQLYTYKEDIDRVLFLGGMYMLLLHSDLQCRPEYVRVIGDIARYLRSKEVLIASPEDLAHWWVAKNALEVSCKVRSKRRLAIMISNPSPEPIANAVVQVNINREVTDVRLASDIIGTEIPPFKFVPALQEVAITVPYLARGASLSLYLDYEREND
jgi:hypothetical protein